MGYGKCWNSTFDMLDFALWYWAGIDGIMDKNKLGVSGYALGEKDWELLR